MPRFDRRRPLVVAATLALGLSWATTRPGGAQDRVLPEIPPGRPGACQTLATLDLPDVTIRHAEAVPAGAFTPPGASSALDVPAFCRLAATAAPAVNFEVWLPEAWNGKFQVVGNGGMAGSVSYAAMRTALDRGYATASTDTGHTAVNGAFDTSWAMGHPELVEDFGHRALHLTTRLGKQVVDRHYGRPPEFAYYVGCSKGGQQGLMEAQRYPDDFDGIIAGNPANDWTRFYAGAHLWYSLATLRDPDAWIPPAKLPILEDAVNATCDALDGIEDGILNDPRRCGFDPAVLTCGLGDDPDTCFTAAQVGAVEAIWAGSRDPSGALVYPGLVPGGEAAPGGWERWVTGSEPFASIHFRAADGFFRDLVFENADWDFRSFDYGEDLAFALEKVGPALDSANPDLRPLRDRGAKLLVYHGWADPDISALASINYYEAVVAELAEGRSSEASLTATQDFFRLFLVPGMGHCRGGPGPDRFDALSALEAWVERGEAPTRIVASKIVDGEVVRSRPLCAYPAEARWTGTGSTDEAASFRCLVP